MHRMTHARNTRFRCGSERELLKPIPGLPQTGGCRRVIVMASAIVAFAWISGSQIATQFELLSDDLHQGLSQIVSNLQSTQWGAWMFLRAQEVNLTSATRQVMGGLCDSGLRGNEGVIFRHGLHVAKFSNCGPVSA